MIRVRFEYLDCFEIAYGKVGMPPEKAFGARQIALSKVKLPKHSYGALLVDRLDAFAFATGFFFVIALVLISTLAL